MVVCKYYRQGNCSYGQYCQFEHINTFGPTPKPENCNEEEYTAVVVAKEVLIAERGGQWLLSCFGPFRDKPPIPGMEDLSPEEVRWEMYQAQKSGMVEQAKLRFQQLCQDMKARRDALKNPTRETITMLKKLLGPNQKSGINTNSGHTAAKSSNFSFATPQLGLSNNNTGPSTFANKTFGAQNNPFSGGFASSGSSSVFGRPNNTSNPVFGGTTNFAGNLGAFGGTPNANSVFGGTTNTSAFNTGQSNQNFGSMAPQNNPIFGGGSAQPVFGQPNAFGASNQVNNVFVRPQTSQSTTQAFNTGATPPSSLFNSPMTFQSSTSSIFGGTKTSTANPFGTSTTLQQSTNSVFGPTATSGNFSSGIFAQSKTLPAFGGAPIFGGGANFSNNSGPMFGEQTAFGGSTMASNIFGGTSNAAPSFSSAGQSANTFGGTVATPAVNIFGAAQTAPPIISATVATPFGTTTPSTSSPFVTAPSQFDSTNTIATPFSRPPFGLATGSAGESFGATVTSSAGPFSGANTGVNFGSANATNSPFATAAFGELKNSPFTSTNTTVTTTNSNPFAPRTQQTNSQFGNIGQNQLSSNVTGSSSGPFGKSPFGSTVTSAVVQDSVYTIEGNLTDDEKNMYLAEKFTFGKIPRKPPTKDIR